MVQIGALSGGFLSLVSGLIFGYVGRIVSKRQLTGDERFANQAFVFWWVSLSGMSIAGAAFNVAAAYGFADLALYTVFLLSALVILCGALWALGYYLSFLYLGTSRLAWPIAIFYGFYAFLLLYLVVAADPVRVVVGRWTTTVEYANPDLFASNALVQALLFVLLLPQIAAALAYMSLLFKVHAAAQQYRIAMVSSSILLWFGSRMVASLGGFNDADWWTPTSRAIALVASFAILLAYRPPDRIVEWLSARDHRLEALRGRHHA